MNSKILEINNLNYSISNKNLFGKEEQLHILKNISFEMNRGEILGIAGESGSGKTTLGKIIAGIIKADSGSLNVHSSDQFTGSRTSPVQILFQNNGEILNPFRRISEIVKETYIIRNGRDEDIQGKIDKIFNSVQLNAGLQNKKGFQLSGGEQQRAALARILAAQPELLILDEPFSAQDPKSKENLVNLFKKLNRDFKISMICIAHNLELLRDLCDSVLVIYKGEIVESGKCDEVFSSPKHAYTKYLLKAEKYDLTIEELKSISGISNG